MPLALHLTLTPGRMRLARPGNPQPLLDLEGPGADAAGLPALLGHPALKARPLRVRVSDAWVRYDLIHVATGNLTETDARQLAEAHYRDQYGAPAWPLRHTAHPGGLLVAGLAPEVLAALQQARLDLTAVEPCFAAFLDAAAARLSRHHGWLLVDEGEVAVLASFDQGRLASLRCHFLGADREQALRGLLARQAALEARDDTSVLYHALLGAPPALPGPWRIESLEWPKPGLFSRLLGG